MESSKRIQSLLAGNEDDTDKCRLLKDRVCDIDKTIAELMYEKRRCLDLERKY